MKWPPQSPDLNPIENVWGLMKTYLRKRAVNPKNPIDLFRILSNKWNTLLDSYFQKLVASMPKRIEMVRENKGDLRSTSLFEFLVLWINFTALCFHLILFIQTVFELWYHFVRPPVQYVPMRSPNLWQWTIVRAGDTEVGRVALVRSERWWMQAQTNTTA